MASLLFGVTPLILRHSLLLHWLSWQLLCLLALYPRGGRRKSIR